MHVAQSNFTFNSSVNEKEIKELYSANKTNENSYEIINPTSNSEVLIITIYALAAN